MSARRRGGGEREGKVRAHLLRHVERRLALLGRRVRRRFPVEQQLYDFVGPGRCRVVQRGPAPRFVHDRKRCPLLEQGLHKVDTFADNGVEHGRPTLAVYRVDIRALVQEVHHAAVVAGPRGVQQRRRRVLVSRVDVRTVGDEQVHDLRETRLKPRQEKGNESAPSPGRSPRRSAYQWRARSPGR